MHSQVHPDQFNTDLLVVDLCSSLAYVMITDSFQTIAGKTD